MIESERLGLEEAQKNQQRQMLLGPGAAMSGGNAQTNAPLPQMWKRQMKIHLVPQIPFVIALWMLKERAILQINILLSLVSLIWHPDKKITSAINMNSTPALEPEEDTVPIIVGSILAVIVVVVLAWYIVMRFRKRIK